jgi:hypothetical protein
MIAPVLHALLFGIASLLLLFSDAPVLDGPARFPIIILWTVDIPISLIASARLFFHDEYAKLVWALWGFMGTLWWYFLGISIEDWIKRLSKKA